MTQYSSEASLWPWPSKQLSTFHTNTPAHMKYHAIKFGCKKIRSSIDMAKTVIFDSMSLHCDLELKDSKPIFLHDTLAYDDASTYLAWLQKFQQLSRYHPEEHLLELWPFHVTLTLTTTKQSNLFTGQSCLWWCAIQLSLVAKGPAVQKIY